MVARVLLIGLAATTGAASAAPAVGMPGRIDPSTIPPLPADFVPPPPPSARRGKAEPVTSTFVDSQGRSLMYRFALPDGVDAGQPQPVMIYFHGNNSGTQQEIIDAFFPGIEFYATQRGLAAVMVASPQTRAPPQETIRQWYDEDELTVQEFLTQRLPTHFAVDNRRIYFMGGSQGTCFLNDFMHAFGESYGGGFFGGCGCFNSLDVTWTPAAEFVEGMKIYIGATRGDFLIEPSWNGYGLYKYTLGLDTRGDLEEEGGHCSNHWTQLERALDWFTGEVPIPEEPFRPHWSRVSARDDVFGLALTDDGVLWMTTYDNTTFRTTVHRSADRGSTWTPVSETDAALRQLVASGTSLLVVDGLGVLRRSDDGGETFGVVANDRNYADVLADGAGTTYLVDGAGALLSGDAQGGNRTPLAAGPVGFLHRDVVRGIAAPQVLATDDPFNPTLGFLGSATAGSLSPMAPLPEGTLQAATWDGSTLYALARPAGLFGPVGFRSANAGGSWEPLPLPAPFASYYWFSVELMALGPGQLVANGGFFQSSWWTRNGGVSWSRLPGLATASSGDLVADGSLVAYSDGTGVFRLVTADPVGLFADGFEGDGAPP